MNASLNARDCIRFIKSLHALLDSWLFNTIYKCYCISDKFSLHKLLSLLVHVLCTSAFITPPPRGPTHYCHFISLFQVHNFIFMVAHSRDTLQFSYFDASSTGGILPGVPSTEMWLIAHFQQSSCTVQYLRYDFEKVVKTMISGSHGVKDVCLLGCCVT
jgi:hypothetical protein